MFDTFTEEYLTPEEWSRVVEVPAFDYERQQWVRADHCHHDVAVAEWSPLFCGTTLGHCPGEPS